MTPMPAHQWVFRARSERVIDGDTVLICVDGGMRSSRSEPFRLFGVNCSEMHGGNKKTRAQAQAAKDFTDRWLQTGRALDEWPLIVETAKPERDKYGRYLAMVWRVSDGRQLNDDLLTSGNAVVLQL